MELLERDRQARELASAFSDAHDGNGAVVLVRGEAGAGKTVFLERFADGHRGIPRGPRSTTAANPFGLTNRQVEVLELLSRGMSNAEIADQLFISSKTAGHHVSAILAKLAISSRVEAATIAVERGLAAPNGE